MRFVMSLAALLILATGYTAQASPVAVTFSYKFLDGTTISGTVDGDLQADGDRVLDLHSMTAVYSGQPGTTFTFDAPFGLTDTLSLSGIPSFGFFGFATDPSLDGTHFGFEISKQGATNDVTVGTFTTASGILNSPLGPNAIEANEFVRSSYSAVAVPLASVPEPASIALVGIGLAGAIVTRQIRLRRKIS